MTKPSEGEILDRIKRKIAKYRVDVHKPAQSPNLADWILLDIENIMREIEEVRDIGVLGRPYTRYRKTLPYTVEQLRESEVYDLVEDPDEMDALGYSPETFEWVAIPKKTGDINVWKPLNEVSDDEWESRWREALDGIPCPTCEKRRSHREATREALEYRLGEIMTEYLEERRRWR